MAVDQRDLPAIIERVFARDDVLGMCHRNDLGMIVSVLMDEGVTQSQIATLTGLPQNRLSQWKKGVLKPSAKSNFEKFANGLNVPNRARQALGVAPLDSEDHRSSNGLAIPTDMFDLQMLAETIGKRGRNVKRREMLELMAKVGAISATAQSEIWDRINDALGKSSHVTLDERLVHELEARTLGFHQLEEILPAPSLFKGVAGHLKELSTLLNGTSNDPDDELRNRLIVATGESSLIAGWYLSDMGNSAAARNFYETAVRAAKEAGDEFIQACALGYRSYIPSTKANHGFSRKLLGDALDLIGDSPESPGTLAWLSARHAEESAALQDRQTALRSWGRASEAFSVTYTDEDRIWTRFMDRDRFDSYQIATYAKIPGKLDEAQELAEAVLARTPQSDKKKAAIILEEIARAHLSRGSVGEASRLAKEGLSILRETGFSMWLPRFEELAQGLARWRRTDSVRNYMEELATTKRQLGSSPA